MLAIALFLSSLASAGELAGVTLPDTATVGGSTLVLNGMGLREKLWIDVYVGGLYLTAKSSDADAIIAADAPKRIVMHFIYSAVGADKMRETYTEGFAGVPNAAAMADRVEKLKSMMADVVAGDEIILDYVPGTGTTVTVKGTNKGTIEGADFMKALWAVYIGAVPPTEKFKLGMLGK